MPPAEPAVNAPRVLIKYKGGKGDFPPPPRCQHTGCVNGRMVNNNPAKSIMCVLDMLLIFFKFGHGKSPFLNNVRGGSTPCCRPLIAYQQRRAGLSTVGEAHLLAIDWLGWFCYLLSIFLLEQCNRQNIRQSKNSDCTYKSDYHAQIKIIYDKAYNCIVCHF